MEVFDIRVALRTNAVRLFVVPFEIQSVAPTIGYLWSIREFLPSDSEDLQRIGKEIKNLYLFQDE